ncbi:Transferrin-binding protein 1 precursor [Kingella potus]|uniref:Transferrin-binding protein 1 n=5 Tax=Kingella potus TaxID=265175 RepID=A0A377R5S7_9NEIS|nr:TonB-dependent receptor [Kingella potus]STR03332.1 Transferrin-binding protein 1 precursor [Kingella potus]
MNHTKLNTLAACLGLLFCTPEIWAEDAAPAQNAAESNALDAVTVHGKRMKADEKGEAQQYSKNVSNAYLGKEYLERYQTDAAGDILKGLNGVYNMNTRNAGSAITPSIRGISGKGRIPVTIDGTEQTVDVWMNNYGTADRNYVDPALFRSIAVEKSPAMTRGIKSGVGGAVAISTIEADDIVPEGDKWGIQIKGSLSDNTAKPRVDNLQYLGWEDYRTIPGHPIADGPAGGVESTGERYRALTFTNYVTPDSRSHKLSNFKGDRSGMIAAAFKTNIADGLIAYSDRKKGNYFSGKRGAGGYLYNPVYDSDYADFGNTSATMIPNMAKLYRPGEEVFNSNVESKSLLLKNNWHLPHNQTISLSHLRTRVRFGENNPFYNALVLGFSNAYNFVGQQPSYYPIQGLDSRLQTKSYKLGYSWQPENSRWIDLQANIWRTRTDSSRHQSGGPELNVILADNNYDNWVACHIRHEVPEDLRRFGMSCADVPREEPAKEEPPIPGAYRVRSGSEQNTRATRLGADISNRFRLTDNLSMTLSANIQHEKLDETTKVSNNDNDFYNIIGAVSTATAIAGPRAGRRHEWGGGLVFDWQPTARLNIQAGVRYDKFWAYDDALAKERKAKRDPFYSSNMSGVIDGSGYIIGVDVPYYEIIGNKEEADDIRRIENAYDGTNIDEVNRLIDRFRSRYGYDYDYVERRTHTIQDRIQITDRNGEIQPDSDAVYRLKYAYAPYTNGQFQGPLFRKGQFDERVDNPQGLRGSYLKYLNGMAMNGWGGGGPNENYLERQNAANQARNAAHVHKMPTTEEELWPTPKHLKARAWSPLLAVSYDLTDKSRLFFRFAQATRFPSIYEATTTNVNLLYPHNLEFDLKPERSTNWEIGYAFNFAPYSKRLKAGDIRITYYDNTIRNAIDISENKNIVQYEKKQTSGIELQSRIDSGKWFATFGANYRLKQRVCDKTTAWNYDIYNNRIPECIDGGFGATRFYQTMQPKYSLNLDAGTRRLNNRLELGMRGTYHSTVSTKQQDELAAQGLARILEATGRPYHWRASLVFDMYAKYRIGKNFGLNLGITNLTNRYYLDPMSNVPVPAPGRAVTFGFTGKF